MNNWQKTGSYTEGMTRTLSKRAFRRQVDRIGFDAAANEYEKWLQEAAAPIRHRGRWDENPTTWKAQR